MELRGGRVNFRRLVWSNGQIVPPPPTGCRVGYPARSTPRSVYMRRPDPLHSVCIAECVYAYRTSICLCMSVCMFILISPCLSLNLSVYLYTYSCTYVCFFCLYMYLPMCLSMTTTTSILIPAYLSACLSTCTSIYLYACVCLRVVGCICTVRWIESKHIYISRQSIRGEANTLVLHPQTL